MMKIETSVGAKSPPVGDGTATPPVVVFLHGRGSDESSAAMFATVFAGATLLAPRGTLREGGGYAWFRNHSPGVADPSSLKDCVDFLENWTDVHVPSPNSNLWLCGYSNGAAAAGALLLSKPDLYRGAILISGPIVSERPWPIARLRGLSILMIYGEDDLVIPRHLLTASATYLAVASGAHASILAAPGGHDISQSSLIATRKWFAKEVELSRHAALKSPPSWKIAQC
jgi:phospholipase/carboxylesterase